MAYSENIFSSIYNTVSLVVYTLRGIFLQAGHGEQFFNFSFNLLHVYISPNHGSSVLRQIRCDKTRRIGRITD